MPRNDQFKPRRLTPAQRKELLDLGIGRQKKFDVQPDFEVKTVMVDGCQVCGQLFASPRAVCPRCGNCVFCGAYNDNHETNYCFVCGNTGPPPPEPPAVYVNL